MTLPQVSIQGLYLYPVKSLAGIALSKAKLCAQGLQGDREWMIVNSKGKALTQRQLPQLAQIRCRPAELESNIENPVWVLSESSMGDIELERDQETELIHCNIWQEQCRAQPALKEANQWITEYCKSQEPLRFVHYAKDLANNARPTIKQGFGEHSAYFADAAPLLVCNSASLEALQLALQAKREAPVNMRRFRPNIVISGIDAFTEHHYQTFKPINNNAEIVIGLIDHCQRCAVISIDQSSGVRGKKGSPFKTLASLNAMPNNPKAAAFGVNAVVERGQGQELVIGQKIELS